MGRRRPLEETLDVLRAVRQDPRTDRSLVELRRVLTSEGSHAVARAAAIVREHALAALSPELVGSFARFLDRPARSDPGCTAKTAIVEALRRLDLPECALFRRAAAHVQMEPVFGGRVDTAVDLRGAAALALAEQGGGEVLVDLAHLLADAEPPVRFSAARALAVCGRDAAIPLLHFKAMAGDVEPRVVSECLLSLLRLDQGQLAFVAARLDADDASAAAAAAALGESRLPAALAPLREWLPRATRRGLAPAALFAVAASRGDGAMDLLLAAVRDEPAPVARAAITALASVRADEAMHARVRAAAGARPELEDALAHAGFPK